MTKQETFVTHKTSDEIGNVHQALEFIMAEAIRNSEKEPEMYVVGALSYNGQADKHVAIALTQHNKLLVAGKASLSDWTAPLTYGAYLTLFPIKLPEGWELDIAHGEWFEFDDDGGSIVLVGPLEEDEDAE